MFWIQNCNRAGTMMSSSSVTNLLKMINFEQHLK